VNFVRFPGAFLRRFGVGRWTLWILTTPSLLSTCCKHAYNTWTFMCRRTARSGAPVTLPPRWSSWDSCPSFRETTRVLRPMLSAWRSRHSTCQVNTHLLVAYPTSSLPSFCWPISVGNPVLAGSFYFNFLHPLVSLLSAKFRPQFLLR